MKKRKFPLRLNLQWDAKEYAMCACALIMGLQYRLYGDILFLIAGTFWIICVLVKFRED